MARWDGSFKLSDDAAPSSKLTQNDTTQSLSFTGASI
jgi:hypothetical protein